MDSSRQEPLYGRQTRLAIDNFAFGSDPVPLPLLAAIARIKQAVARIAGARGWLPEDAARAIAVAAEQVAAHLQAGRWREQFPVELYQTGSGTSSHMNVNEVIAALVQRDADIDVDPNDDVNFAQSSNDVFPSAIRIACLEALRDDLLPALERLEQALLRFAARHEKVVKTARTHLMDAVPITVGQEFSGFAAQLAAGRNRLLDTRARMAALPLGGTAAGTGINVPDGFAPAAPAHRPAADRCRQPVRFAGIDR